MEKEVVDLIHDLAEAVSAKVAKEAVDKALLAEVVLGKSSRLIYSLIMYDVLHTLSKSTEYICVDGAGNLKLMIDFYEERLRELTKPGALERMKIEIKKMKESI